MNEVLLFASVLVGVVTALTQIIKTAVPHLSKNYVPLIALCLGVLVGAAAYPFAEGLDLTARLWAGGFAGLASTGLFEIGNERKGSTGKFGKVR
ncbi:holin [Aureibacillus halotolerans]|uniref:A118-like holin Hol118 n=1 Tax=Aureibacillus halotolerans TaxID=1508390 RepID=A0A4R6TZ49_9BACI|nr:holin [Aureibacillus halotolerans]TDQ39250.1 A118-like holin Hol118 [Aureibacillus halotolerans]